MDEIEEVDEVIIPLYRARKTNSKKWVIGYLKNKNTIITTDYYYAQGMPPEVEENFNKIDETTLAIHLPDMIDSQRNKIFAALNKTGIGGDILNKSVRGNTKECIAKFSSRLGFHLEYDGKYYTLCDELSVSDLNDFGDFCQFKIKGIKE